MSKETAIRASFVAALASLGVGVYPMMRTGGNFRGKYGKCESCGNPTKERGRCHKCKSKEPESTPDILVIHADGREEMINLYPPPYQIATRQVDVNGLPFTVKL